MTTVPMLFVAKLTLLLGLGMTVATLLRGRSAATRHFVWMLTLGGAVALAIVANVAPSVTLAIPDWRQPATVSAINRAVNASPQTRPALETAGRATSVTARLTAPSTRLSPHQRDVPALRLPFASVLAGLWALGFAAMLAWTIAGHAGVFRIVRSAKPANDPQWTALTEETVRCIGVTRPVRVCLSPAIGAPFTSGWSRPIILLPEDAATWPEDRRRAALMHELAHIARNDYPVHLLATFACALYWFHPAAWFALRRLRRESEQATDDRVIARGMIAPDYATHLLGVARAAHKRGFSGLVAVGMACPSHLETRLRALLDETRIRNGVSGRLAVAAVAGLALLLVPLAAAKPELRTAEPLANAPHKRNAEGASVGSSTSYQRTFDVSPGGTLVLDLETGATVDITGGDEPQVRINATLKGRDADKTIVDAAASGGEIRVTSKFEPLAGSTSTSHTFVVRVPRRFNVRLKSSGGGLSIASVEGTFEGTTGGGSINLTHLRGLARLSTGGGDVEVTDSELDGNVSTGGGTVRLERILGGLVGTSGSEESEHDTLRNGTGLISVSDLQSVDEPDKKSSGLRVGQKSSSVLRISKAGGDIDLEEAPNGAVVTTGGGRITIGRAAGRVTATTGGGRISIGPVAGSVTAATGAGDIEIKVVDAGGRAQTVDLNTGSGTVVVDLPPGFDGRLEIETAYTKSHGPVRIHSDWSLQNDPVTDWDARQGTPRRYVRAHGSAGSGRGLVRIHAVNGDVTLRRR